LEISLANLDDGLALTKRTLRHLGAPQGSELHVVHTSVVPIVDCLAVLTDQELWGIADSHVRGEAVASRLQAVKLCDVDSPPGAYFTTQLVGPVDGILLGSGGFFVDRNDGAITEFGSGELYKACAAQHGGRFPSELQVTPAVVRFLIAKRSHAVVAAPKHWWQFWR